jgi:transposase
LFDINTQIPAFIHISPASNHDVNAMDFLIYEIGAYYIFDRGYVDFTLDFIRLINIAAFFVVRAKSNLKFNRMYSRKYDKSSGVKSDQIGKLTGFYVSKEYPDKTEKDSVL